MLVNTKAYGKIDVDERQRLYFPYGILGFEKLTDYVLLDARQQPFYWLQSLESQEIAFIMITPSVFRPDYTPDVSKEELAEIELENNDDMLLFAIVTIPQKQSEMTANLQGPIMINKKTKTGRQSITTNPKWKVKHYILDELAKVRTEAC